MHFRQAPDHLRCTLSEFPASSRSPSTSSRRTLGKPLVTFEGVVLVFSAQYPFCSLEGVHLWSLRQMSKVTRMRQREGFIKKVPPSPRLGKRQTPKRPFTFTLENGLTLIAPWEVAKSETTLHFHLGKWLHPYCTLGRDEIRRDPSPSPLLPHGKWQNLK
ncbi:hypothetical protein BHE74_00003109 [Ensete ventricosum]|nr:hypothetical protein BHE74_00003109 [Ensete ventricosum]